MKNDTQKLIEQVKQARQGQFTSIKTKTPVKLLKGTKNNRNPLADCDIQKESTQSAQFCNYSNAVNNKQVREGGEADFESQPLPDHLEYVDDCRSLVRNTKSGQVYIQYKPNGKANVLSVTVDGEEINEEQKTIAHEWQPSRKSDSGKVTWRRVKIENVLEIN